MEVGSTIAKAFKRFTIPRSTSAIGSFTTSNGTASNNIEITIDESMPPPSESLTHSSSTEHKHPPLSYVQNIRLSQQQQQQQQQRNPDESTPQPHASTPPLRENISSVMIRSPSADEYTPKKSKLESTSKKSHVARDISFDNLNDVSSDHSLHEKSHKANGHHRSSIKSLLTKKFHPVSVSTSVNITPKQKKSRTSFRPFSQFLKRSHSTNTDLALPTSHPTVELIDQRIPSKSSQEPEVANVTRTTTNTLGTSANTGLVPISEEDHPIQSKLQIKTNDIDETNLNRSDSGISTSQQTTKITNSFSASSSSSPPSGASSKSNKYLNVNTQSQLRDETISKPLKASLSMTNNPVSSQSTLPHNMNYPKPILTTSISLYNDVNHLTASNANNSIDRPVLQQTLSARPEIETNNENQPITKVKMRDHGSKKKKGLRELKSRISLPPEIKSTSITHTNQQAFETNNIRYKLAQRSSYYQTNSSSVQAFSDVLNQSNMSLARLSPYSAGPASRNEHRRSMLDLGFGKIESYSRLEKLGEGTYATVYKGTSNMVSGFVALKEIRLEQEEGAPCTALREVSLLKGLKHNNIVCLYDIIFDQTTLTLVFEYVEKDLKQYMEDCSNILSMKNVRLFLFQLLRGLEYCHGKKILHRDLKPQNLLINERGELKLADFGLARVKSFPTKTYSHEVVTLWYRPPDVLLGSTEYSTPIDIWAVGCIFYEMACGRPLFAGTKVEEELYLIFKYLGTPTEQTLPGVTSKTEFRALKLPFYFGESFTRLAPRLDTNGIDLLQNFLRYNPLSRISAYDALRHNFFACYPPEILNLGPLQSVLDLNEVTLTKDHGSKYNATSLMKNAISKRSSVHL